MQLAHLFILFIVNSVTVFGLLILLLRSIYSLAFNITTIESWEIERHETLVRRARVLGGHLEGPGGVKVQIKKQEFPYDIGIWSNIRDGMGGSANVCSRPFKWRTIAYNVHRSWAGFGHSQLLPTVGAVGNSKRMALKVCKSPLFCSMQASISNKS